MKPILLPLSLLLLLLAAGCSAQGAARVDPMVAQQLHMDDALAEALGPSVQNVDATDTSARPWATTGSSTSSTT